MWDAHLLLIIDNSELILCAHITSSICLHVLPTESSSSLGLLSLRSFDGISVKSFCRFACNQRIRIFLCDITREKFITMQVVHDSFKVLTRPPRLSATEHPLIVEVSVREGLLLDSGHDTYPIIGRVHGLVQSWIEHGCGRYLGLIA
jgi:hypothetical protein